RDSTDSIRGGPARKAPARPPFPRGPVRHRACPDSQVRQSALCASWLTIPVVAATFSWVASFIPRDSGTHSVSDLESGLPGPQRRVVLAAHVTRAPPAGEGQQDLSRNVSPNLPRDGVCRRVPESSSDPPGRGC